MEIFPDTWTASLDSTARRGLIVSFGNASGAVTGVILSDLASRGSLFVTRPGFFDYYRDPAERAAGSEDSDERLDGAGAGGDRHVTKHGRVARLACCARSERERGARVRLDDDVDVMDMDDIEPCQPEALQTILDRAQHAIIGIVELRREGQDAAIEPAIGRRVRSAWCPTASTSPIPTRPTR